MHFQKMVQDVQQSQYMRPIVPALSHANVVDDHVANPFAAILLRHQILSERCCRDFGKVFMLRDRKDLFLAHATEMQSSRLIILLTLMVGVLYGVSPLPALR
jgi:hypothetical protein